MSALRFVLWDQLSEEISSLEGLDLECDVVLIFENYDDFRHVPHHKKKIAFLLSSMRHFAEHLKNRGIQVDYIPLSRHEPHPTMNDVVEACLARYGLQRVIVTEPSEWRTRQQIDSLAKHIKCPLEVRQDHRFLCSIEAFALWSSGKTMLRMEFFYRMMRQKWNILLNPDHTPVGGQWNYDKENRKSPHDQLTSPKRLSHKKDEITEQVLAEVEEIFPENFGVLKPFHMAVTRAQALLELDHFIRELLPFFGDFQDAMVKGEVYLYHSLLASYLNVGLLLPLEICQRAEKAYDLGLVPLNAAEGFIRQILGWREYIRGIYWTHMPRYQELNFFRADRPLPKFYWTAQTHMSCVREAVKHTQEHAYSHHIQRLMVTGNLALLAGIDPHEVCEWYLIVYADAFEWVELPNTLGMALFGDGGIVGSKPYAASGKYIKRMSNFCEGCFYDPELSVGERACPLNALYWNFLHHNQDKLQNNPRLGFAYNTWGKMSPEKKHQLIKQAQSYLENLDEL